MLVREIMSDNVITVSADTEIAEAARMLLDNHINGIPVVDDSGKLVGVISQGDLVTQQKSLRIPSLFTFLDGYIPLASMKHLDQELRKIAAASVSDAMSSEPVTVGPDATVEEVATLMVERKVHTIPVVDRGKLVGIVGKEDILRTIIQG